MKKIITGWGKLGLPLLLLPVHPVQAVPSYNAAVSTTEMTNILDGPGLAISNLAVTKGAAQQYGIFTAGKDVLGVDTGLFMTTGNLDSISAPNTSGAYSHNTTVQVLDSDLASISANAKYDPVTIEFDIVPQGDRVNFIFAFGSDEYPEYVCSRFNDAFGLFVSGPGINGVRNAAFMPGTSDPVAVNNVNAGKPGQYADGSLCNLGNTAYFVDNGNGNGAATTQMDGYTKATTASLGGLMPGQKYHVKLAMADAGDPAYDSGVAFKWLTSTKSAPVDLSLQASANPSTPLQGGEVELSYTVKNSSSTSTSLVAVNLALPAGLSWVGDDANGAFNPVSGDWSVGNIAAYGSKTLKVRVRVGPGNAYTVPGEITFAFNEDPDSTPFNKEINPAEDDTAMLTFNTTTTPINQPPVITNDESGGIAFVKVQEGQTGVGVIQATDADGDTLSYRITGGSDTGKFTINPVTGALSFISAPDFENPQDANRDNRYEVQVTVSDGVLSDTLTLEIQVTNMSENAPPVIVSDGGGDVAYVSAEENQVFVTTVNATDADGDTLSFSITGGKDATLFRITTKGGNLQFVNAPDYEKALDLDKNNVYEVQVTVRDGSLSDVQTLQVAIVNLPDENQPPSIRGGAIVSLSVPENQTLVTTVMADDPDNDSIVYQITGGADAPLFTVDSRSGVVSFVAAPDYENPADAGRDNQYEVTVAARDSTGLGDTQALLVNVMDAGGENQPPVITNPSSLQSKENYSGPIIDLGAIDNQDVEGAGLRYSLTGQVDDAHFVLNSDTGEIAHKYPLDYENPQDANQDNAYIIGVKVCDSENACAERTLIIVVQDIDEDSDGDGMMDSVEALIGTDPWKADTDGDGLGDLQESEEITAPLDHDKDGLIDALDPDDDNDTIPTRYEMADPDGDKNQQDARDTDNDGVPDYLDDDDDGDTLLTRYERPDTNGDGNPTDARDTDNDGMPDYLDADDDNDNSDTAIERPDPNSDGNPEDAVDSNGNGIPSWLDEEEDMIVTVSLKTFLQGPFNMRTGLMNNELRQQEIVPLLQPYGKLKTAFGYVDSGSSVSPFDYKGTETIAPAVWNATGVDAVVDWVLVELRDRFDPTIRVSASAGVLQRDGDVVDAATGGNVLRILNVVDGDYYVVVRHRNHLAVMTQAPVNLRTPPKGIDFTNPATLVRGGHEARLQNASVAMMWAGDTNNSNSIILSGPGSDSNVILGAILISPGNRLVNVAFRLGGYYSTDLNMDGVAVYSGPNNDVNLLLANVIMHPGNVTSSTNYMIQGKAPMAQ